MKKLKLPTGIQSFRKIREGGYYYVDKTRFAIDLIENGSYYFLSRPRRFGKSLFIDTLAELFSGNRKLFEGLYAEQNWNWERRHPVIRISFGEGRLQSREELDFRIRETLSEEQNRLGIVCQHQSISGTFSQLLRLAAEKFGERVVVLVDEYDKPILDNIEDRNVAVEMREGLKNFYSVLKGADPYLRFVLLTGVSKFSKVSLFSGLNNLTDITLDRNYSAICGYTEEDLLTTFAPELEQNHHRGALDLEKVRHWYNGYNWLGTAVYNPFNVLQLFRTGEFRAWWYETGTPSFLLKILQERPVFAPDLGRMLASSQLLSTFDVGNIPTEALMWQTGYLTIKETHQEGAATVYRLGFPNLEIAISFYESLLLDWANGATAPLETRSKILHSLRNGDFEAMRIILSAFYASIPYQWFTNNPLGQYEGYYASVFYAFFASLGLDLAVEESCNVGRLDMVMQFENRTVLFEFKVVADEAEGKALAQMKQRGYAEKYRGHSCSITLVGIEFSKRKRNIVGWEVEEFE